MKATFTPDTENGQIIVDLATLGDGTIYYTLDGTEPTTASAIYDAPLIITEDAIVKANVVRPSGTTRTLTEPIRFSKATAKPITLKQAPNKAYTYNGAPVLNDGLSGNENYKTGRWIGFSGKDLEAVIDLQKTEEIHELAFNTNVVQGDWIMGASAVTVKVSEDGKNFRQVYSEKIPSVKRDDKDGLFPHTISFKPVKARYVEVLIKSDKMPNWHPAAGKPAFLFVDEIRVN